MFTSLFYSLGISTFYLGFGTGLIFSSLGLALFGRFLFKPSSVDVGVQSSFDTVEAGVLARTSTTEVGVGSDTLPSYSDICVNTEAMAISTPVSDITVLPTTVLVNTDPYGNETAVMVFDNPEMVDEAFMYVDGELTDLPDVPFAEHTYVNAGTDALSLVNVGTNTEPIVVVDAGVNTVHLSLNDVGVNTVPAVMVEASVGPDLLLNTATDIQVAPNSNLVIVETGAELDENLIELHSLGVTPVETQFPHLAHMILNHRYEVLPGDGFADLAITEFGFFEDPDKLYAFSEALVCYVY